MVISVSELTKRILEKEEPLLKALEDRIDTALVERFNGQSVAIGLTTKMPRRNLLDELFDKYRRSGWDVQYVFDQRYGDFIQLKPKIPEDRFYDRHG